MWSPEENWNELRVRLEQAVATIDELSIRHEGAEWVRLRGKAEGVRLVLAYMDDADRVSGPRA